MADSFELVLGKRRGRSSNLGQKMRGQRLERLRADAQRGDVEAAHELWRRDHHINNQEKDTLKQELIAGAIKRVSDELDLTIHWRRTLSATKLFDEKSNYLLAGPGRIIHLSNDGERCLCGASSNLFRANRGRWAVSDMGWSRCHDCQEDIDNLCPEGQVASQERPELVPLTKQESEELRDNIQGSLDFNQASLLPQTEKIITAYLYQCLARRLSDDSQVTLKAIQRQMIRTSQIEIRRRSWQLWGVRRFDDIEPAVWHEVAEFMLSEPGAQQILWGGFCHVMAIGTPRHSIARELARTITGPLVIRKSRAERRDYRDLKREKQHRKRAGW